jgi:two-component system NtrC family sensor kinase
VNFLNRLGSKIIIGVSITSILIIGVFAIISITSQKQVLLDQVKHHANQLSETVKNSTKEEMLFNRRDRILKIVNEIAVEPNIDNIRILNKSGEIVYSNDSSEIGFTFEESSKPCFICHSTDEPIKELEFENKFRIYSKENEENRLIGIVNPIFNEETCWSAECHAHDPDKVFLGVLDISVKLDNVDEQIADSQLLILMLAISSVIFLGIIISVFVNRQVVKPVNTIIDATQKVSSGELKYRINSKSKDELGQLANSFDGMTQNVADMKMKVFQADKMSSLGQLAAGIAHEINNPLTGVLTYSSFLLKRAKDNKELADDLNVIVRETKRSREIVKQLLDFSRQSVPKKMSCNINNVIERVISISINQMKVKNITLEKKLMENIPEVIVDPNQLQQVILNLVINAIDAMDKKDSKLSVESKIITVPALGNLQIREAVCPNGHNLIDKDHKIEGLPAIKLYAKFEENSGFIHLNPIYGSRQHHYGIPLIKDKPINLCCPECDVSLMQDDVSCPECKSPSYKIIVPDKGFISGCAKFGGVWQKWEYIDKIGEVEYLLVNVKDNGKGMSNEQLQSIFDPFFSTKGMQGTGLGLSVAWGIIENHNGRIEVQSTESEGTMFTIKLPLKNIYQVN